METKRWGSALKMLYWGRSVKLRELDTLGFSEGMVWPKPSVCLMAIGI